jgi:hypothetical protein
MFDYEWLGALKAGDPVIESHGFEGQRVSRVDRATTSQIIVGHSRYRRKDGHTVGGNGWNRNRIEKPTPEKVVAIKKKSLANKLRGVDWFNLPMATLEGIDALLVSTIDAGASGGQKP